MIDVTTTTVIGVIALLVLATITFFGKALRRELTQYLVNRKRQRAHAGKVKCEEKKEKCDRIAVALTHNGYFCEVHWSENSKREVDGGYVTWHHTLYHHIKGGN